MKATATDDASLRPSASRRGRPRRVEWQPVGIPALSHVAQHAVTLFAYGGRFGGFGVPDGLVPEAHHVLFKIEIPFRDRGHQMIAKRYAEEDSRSLIAGKPDFEKFERQYGRDADDLDQSRVASDPDPAINYPFGYSRSLECERFECNREDEGFRWWLTRRDLRPRLTARVERWDGDRLVLTLGRLTLDTPDGFSVDSEIAGDLSGHVWRVEPDDAGRTRPHVGEVVTVILDEDLKVDRIWPIHHLYLPPECPMCRPGTVSSDVSQSRRRLS